jgi:hypothetical protein
MGAAMIEAVKRASALGLAAALFGAGWWLGQDKALA